MVRVMRDVGIGVEALDEPLALVVEVAGDIEAAILSCCF